MMLRRTFLKLLAAVVVAEPLSPEDAAAKLREREKARTAASQPASEAEDLRAMIRKLQVQVATLKEENNQLKMKLAEAQKKIPAPAAAVKSDLCDPTVKIKAGMKLPEAMALLGAPENTTTRGDGTKTVEWRCYIIDGASGGFGDGGGQFKRTKKKLKREVTAEVDADGVIKDFTDSN